MAPDFAPGEPVMIDHLDPDGPVLGAVQRESDVRCGGCGGVAWVCLVPAFGLRAVCPRAMRRLN
jgi:hypothetical protein